MDIKPAGLLRDLPKSCFVESRAHGLAAFVPEILSTVGFGRNKRAFRRSDPDCEDTNSECRGFFGCRYGVLIEILAVGKQDQRVKRLLGLAESKLCGINGRGNVRSSSFNGLGIELIDGIEDGVVIDC